MTAVAVFFGVAGLRGLRDIAGRLVIASGAAILLLAPLFVAELKFSRFYDPQTKNTNFGFKVSQQFRSFWSYLVDGSHRWLAPNIHYFVQIDFAIWVPIAMAVVAGAVIATRHGGWGVVWRRLDEPVVVFLVASLFVYLFLQIRSSLFVYQVLAPLQVINFPWRMLAYITPLGILLVVQIVDRVMRRYPARTLWIPASAVWLASLILLSPVTSRLGYNDGYLAVQGQFPFIGLFAAPKTIDFQTYEGYFLGSSYGPLYGDFLPKVMNPNGTELHDDLSLYSRIHRHDEGAASLGSTPCTVTGPARSEFECCRSISRSAAPVRPGWPFPSASTARRPCSPRTLGVACNRFGISTSPPIPESSSTCRAPGP